MILYILYANNVQVVVPVMWENNQVASFANENGGEEEIQAKDNSKQKLKEHFRFFFLTWQFNFLPDLQSHGLSSLPIYDFTASSRILGCTFRYN